MLGGPVVGHAGGQAEFVRVPTAGDIQPAEILSHRMKPANAAKGHDIFNQKQEDCRKVVLTP